MSHITEKDVRHVAKLAHLALTDQEITNITPKLEGILSMFDALNAVDTGSMETVANISDEALPKREDKVTDGNLQAKVLQNAPEQSLVEQVHCFVVPKVIESN